MPRLFPLPKRGAVSYADVTSANIVGFQTTTPENNSGYTFITPTFKDVAAGTATYDLQNLKLVGENVGDGCSDLIEVWDETGNMTDTAYFFVTVDQGYEKEGWVTEMAGDVYAEDVSLPLGTGFYLNIGSGEDVQIQYAGEVMKGEVLTGELVQGYNICGNATPVTIDLQDVALVGENVGDGCSDLIEVWDETGNMTDIAYFYVTEAQGYEKDGWVTEMAGDVYAEGVKYAPGQGFYINIGSGDDVQVKLPSVIQ